jgi:hypothetical protein
MVGLTMDKEGATVSGKPTFRWNPRDLTGIPGDETTHVLSRAMALPSLVRVSLTPAAGHQAMESSLKAEGLA